VEHALAGGSPERVGWFRFYFADQRWEWSPQVERMHGYEPGTAEPTTELVLSHKHPDDYGQIAATLEQIIRMSQPFSARHRIIDVHGAVLTSSRSVTCSTTTTERSSERTGSTSTCRRPRTGSRRRSSGKRWRRSPNPAGRSNRPRASVLAEQIAADFLGLEYDESLPPRGAYDRLLLTAHLRVPS
jgi:hypothetical protein